MFNKELFEKIIKMELSEKELLCLKADELEYDLDNAFEKYYSLENILKAIYNCENKIISVSYLAHWANLYNYILMSGFKNKNEYPLLKSFAIGEISWVLDGLSFCDEDTDFYDFNRFKQSFKVFDNIYRNYKKWRYVCSYTGLIEDDILLLLYNPQTKEYVEMELSTKYISKNNKFSIVEKDEIIRKLNKLKQIGYKRVEYWDECPIEELTLNKPTKIVVNKEYLKSFSTLVLVFENCNEYEIDINDILDISCNAFLTEYNNYTTNDGFIKISSSANNNIEYSIKDNNEIGSEFDCRLKERIKLGDNCSDITHLLLKNESEEVTITIPYDPLYEVLHGNEIEHTNCPSYEEDEFGNMLVHFGESSLMPKREDNNYNDLIKGWKDALGDYSPSNLTVDVNSFNTFYNNGLCISLSFYIKNKKFANKFFELIFLDCEMMGMEMYYPVDGKKCDILISKLLNGRIFVGLDMLGIEFDCKSIMEYDYYCKNNKKR